jgi:hypothetical protein
MNSPGKKPDLDAGQVARYLSAQFHAQRGVEEALALLRTRRRQTGDPEERRDIDMELGELQEAAQRIDDERTAFMAENLVVVAPAEASVEHLKQIADRLDRMIASSATASAIVTAAKDILSDWNKTRPA